MNSADPTTEILDWLTASPSVDLAVETRQLGLQLDALHSPTVSSAQFHRCIELFYSRALRLSGEYRKYMRSLTIPLSGDFVASTREFASSLKRVAAGLEKVLLDAKSGTIRSQHRLTETSAARALRLLGEEFLIVSLSGMEPEPEIWRSAYKFFALAREEDESQEVIQSPAETSQFAFKRLLALASLEPQALSPAELDWAAEYVGRIGNQLHIQALPPPNLDGSWYWLDLQSNSEPVACVRRTPSESRQVLFFSTSVLARRAAELIARHEGGRTSQELEPNAQFPGVQPTTLLARLQQRWATPPRREQPRRRQEYEVEACIDLANIWQTLRHGAEASPKSISRWHVLNESPGGYAIMHIQGNYSGLAAGMSVGLRRHRDDAWNICLVRWLRSDAADQVEIGLQVVSKGAIPVQIGFRGSAQQTSMVNALVLPVLPALRQHQAVMAPSGTYASRRFTLVSDIDRLYVAQCRLLSLDIQTSKVELFQFEIDPYPI